MLLRSWFKVLLQRRCRSNHLVQRGQALCHPQRARQAQGPHAILHGLAAKAGMLSLYEDGLRKVAAGVTSLDELLRVTQDQNDG